MNSTRDYVLECLRGFMALRDALQDQEGPTGLANPTDLTAAALTPSQVQSEEVRFKIWCGNIGAHQTGTRSSLDYRLRDASHIRKQVVRILASLSTSLVDARLIVVGETPPLEDEVAGSQDDDDDLPGLEDLGYESELMQIFASVVDSTTRLLRLSITIRNPAPHDRFLRAKATSTKHNEPWDVQHARDKFPQADPELAERLGKALSQRRQYFKYRESHHGRLAHGIGQIGKDEEPGEFGGGDDDDTKTQTVLSTVASSLPLHLRFTAYDHPEQEPAVLDEDETSETGVSQTSFATSTSTPDKLRIPKLPKKASEGPFECHFCYMIISAPNSRAWKRHVHADLQPYICLWKDCSTPHQQFQRRSHWLNHILQYHWRLWYCPLGCTHAFSEREGIRSHILDVHSGAASSTSLNTLSSLGEKPRPFNQEVTCPLCLVELQSITEYAKHVGKHLVDIALFALPSGDVDDGEINDKETPEPNTDSDSDHDSLDHIEQNDNIDEESPRDVHLSQPEDTGGDLGISPNILIDSQDNSDARQSSRILDDVLGAIEPPAASPPGPEALHAQTASGPNFHGPEVLPPSSLATTIDAPQQKAAQESESLLFDRQLMSGAAVADQGRVLEPSEPGLSMRATNKLCEHVLKPLLAKPEFKFFHPLIIDCPRRIKEKEILCLRDLEKTLLHIAPESAKVVDLWLDFCLTTVHCIQTTVEYLTDREQTRPHDPPYGSGYFINLVEQLQVYAKQIADAEDKKPTGDRMEVNTSDEFQLYGGIHVNGKPVQLVRVSKDGKAVSLATGEPVEINEDSDRSVKVKRSAAEEAADEDEIMRSMARRKMNPGPSSD